jgi:hypothetical protein
MSAGKAPAGIFAGGSSILPIASQGDDREGKRGFSSFEPGAISKVSVLRRKLQFEPLAGLLAQRFACQPISFPDCFIEWCFRPSIFVYSGGTAPVFLRTSLLSPQWAPWVSSKGTTRHDRKVSE